MSDCNLCEGNGMPLGWFRDADLGHWEPCRQCMASDREPSMPMPVCTCSACERDEWKAKAERYELWLRQIADGHSAIDFTHGPCPHCDARAALKGETL